MKELSIKIKIGNREYPMKVKTEEEVVLREAGKEINDKIRAYQKQYGIDDYQDLLAMAAVDCFVEKTQSAAWQRNIGEAALEQISTLNKLISSEL